jgi:uncharacterized SAM-binding protein YcdF (DUF218 family)
MVYRPGWRLTWLGRFAVLAALGLIGWGMVQEAYPFLALAAEVPADSLVLEGWLPDYTLQAVIDEMNRGKYQRVYLTGGVILQAGPHPELKTYPDLLRATLLDRGVSPDLLVAVPCPAVSKDRTYASALALHDWLMRQHIACPALNLVTQGPHARRSRLLFGKAFGGGTRIGVIPVTVDDYDPQAWWRTSAGVRDVIGESIAYVYARFFFYQEGILP